jgi:hypothetical protein
MLPRAVCGSLLALATLATPAPGQVKLQWKFKEGDKFYLEEKLVSKSTTEVGGQKQPFEQTQTRLSSLAVKKQTGDSIELEQRIESWKTQTAGLLAGTAEGARLLEEIAKEIVFTIQLKSTGEVTAFKGGDEFMKKLAERDKAEAARFEEIGGQQVLRSMIVLTFDVLPSTTAKKAAIWKKEVLVPMGPLGDYKYTLTYTDLGKGEASIKGTVAFQPARVDASSVGFRVVKMEPPQSELSGKMVFDAAKGRLVSSEWTAPKTGTVTVERQGEQTVFSINGSETRTIRLLDKKP